MSEPMAFGIGNGLFFGYMPFVKIDGIPLTSFRCTPGNIYKRVTKRLEIPFKVQRFKDPEEAMDELDRVVESGIPVGVQVGIFWLPFFPRQMRFHFNVHNCIVYGKEGDEYLMSDPVLHEPVRCPSRALKKARFAKGVGAPKGRMYYLPDTIEPRDTAPAIGKALVRTASDMLFVPVPFFGLRGMRFVAKQLRKWPDKLGEKRSVDYLSHLIRASEEVGTGGAGFRYVFAAFLEEAAEVLGMDELGELSKDMTAVGDKWTQMAVEGARICKGRAGEGESFGGVADIIEECAEGEKAIFKRVRGLLK
jgi:hypothetical protein